MIADTSMIPEALQATLRLTEDADVGMGDSVEDSDTMKLNWRLQGFKLFKVKYYRAAIQCFKNSGDESLMTRCEAYEHADGAAAMRGQHDAKLAMF